MGVYLEAVYKRLRLETTGEKRLRLETTGEASRGSLEQKWLLAMLGRIAERCVGFTHKFTSFSIFWFDEITLHAWQNSTVTKIPQCTQTNGIQTAWADSWGN